MPRLSSHLPTQERLSHAFSYSPETGLFHWKIGARGRRTGSLAGSKWSNGYIVIGLDGGQFYAHRLAWVIMTGASPSGTIDHANGDPDDNRWSNLRSATQSQNIANARIRRDNTSGHKGVRFHQEKGRWQAYLDFQGKRANLGYFDNLDDAISARLAKAREVHGEFARAR